VCSSDLSPRDAVAAPIRCPGNAEFLGLSPGVRVLVDGGVIGRGLDARYSDDAGLVFDVELATLQAIEGPADDAGCLGASTTATLSAIDPFSGAAVTVTVQVAP
jgi:hypothetical protein